MSAALNPAAFDPELSLDTTAGELLSTAGSLDAVDPSADPQRVPPQGLVGRAVSWVLRAVRTTFCVLSLIGVLAVLAAIPVVQWVVLGYTLHVAGRIARGDTVGQSLLGLRQFGTVGLALIALAIAAMPTRLLAHLESVAAIIDPGAASAAWLRVAALTATAAALAYLMWAWIRGGRLRDYLWPQPLRFLRQAWRLTTWRDAADRLWRFTASFESPRLFWLGLRGMAATLVWLIPAMILIAANRNGRTGLAGLVAFGSIVVLGWVLLYLPMLQAHFAAENSLRAMFAVRRIRQDFRRAPWAWVVAMIITLVLTPIPLYLLKIEATPRELVWLPGLMFVAFILPARIACGLALRRARRRAEVAAGWLPRLSRWVARGVMVAVVAIYLSFLALSQYTSWEGLQTWVQQHALLVPVPFMGI